MTIQYLPLSKLVPCPANVRKTDGSSGIEQLAASIAAHGLLQNLQVKPNEKRPVRGRRRRQTACRARISWRSRRRSPPIFSCRATRSMWKTRQRSALPKTKSAKPCIPPTSSTPSRRWPMSGMGDEDIAARFGVTVAVVRQRLKLSRVSPKLIALYRKGETHPRMPDGFRHRRRSQAAGKNLERPARMVARRCAMPSAMRSPRRISRRTASWRVSSPLRRIKPLAVPCCATCSMPIVPAGLPTLPCSTALSRKSWNAKRKPFAPKAGNGSRSCRKFHGIRCAHSTASIPRPPSSSRRRSTGCRAEIIDEDGEASDELAAKLEQLESEVAFSCRGKGNKRCHRQHRRRRRA